MGIEKQVKDYLRGKYGAAFVKRLYYLNTMDTSELASDKTTKPTTTNIDNGIFKCKVGICEAMFKIKGLPPDTHYSNGLGFVKDKIANEIKSLYRLGVDNILLCFDRGSPCIKDVEHGTRAKGKKNEKKIDINDYIDPNDNTKIIGFSNTHAPKDIHGFINNRILIKQLFYYIGQALIQQYTKPQLRILEIPPDKTIYLCGCPIREPKIDPKKKHYYEYDDLGDQYIIKLSATGFEILPGKPSSTDTKDTKMDLGDIRNYNPEDIKRILEGELLCFYLLRFFSGHDIIIITGDGDLLLIGMMHLQYTSVKTLYLRLVHGNKCEDVNLTLLYNLILADSTVNKFQHVMPTLVMVLMLLKNDYIKKFLFGIKMIKIPNHNIKIPVTVYTILKYADMFKNMITLSLVNDGIDSDNENTKNGSKNNASSNLSHQRISIKIDEGLFIKFTQLCYVSHKASYLNGKINQTIEEKIVTVKEQLVTKYKSNMSWMMCERQSLRFSRQVLWMMIYWYNGYRGNCDVPSPLMLYQGLPYFGWAVDQNNHCKSSYAVSPPIVYTCSDELLETRELLPIIISNNQNNQSYTSKILYSEEEWKAFYVQLRAERFCKWGERTENLLQIIKNESLIPIEPPLPIINQPPMVVCGKRKTNNSYQKTNQTISNDDLLFWGLNEPKENISNKKQKV